MGVEKLCANNILGQNKSYCTQKTETHGEWEICV